MKILEQLVVPFRPKYTHRKESILSLVLHDGVYYVFFKVVKNGATETDIETAIQRKHLSSRATMQYNHPDVLQQWDKKYGRKAPK